MTKVFHSRENSLHILLVEVDIMEQFLGITRRLGDLLLLLVVFVAAENRGFDSLGRNAVVILVIRHNAENHEGSNNTSKKNKSHAVADSARRAFGMGLDVSHFHFEFGKLSASTLVQFTKVNKTTFITELLSAYVRRIASKMLVTRQLLVKRKKNEEDKF